MSDISQLNTELIEEPAIEISDVSKIYRLHQSPTDQLIEVLGLERVGLKPKTSATEFPALDSIDLTVPKGERIGIVGRNGAGKSTLLKLICGNVRPTCGQISVNGMVQALLTAGSGFNPDYTGEENVRASLQYNGLSRSEYGVAIEDIKDFCELGPFFDQPFKTYSAGMQARLMFAAATAVKPEILIVDEVLGAGDAYFIAKSKRRVEQLITGGCTMLLVSHSMSQILELCTRTIWMHEGRIHMEGDSFEVVKAYEAFLHGSIEAGGLASQPLHDEFDLGSNVNNDLPAGRVQEDLEYLVADTPVGTKTENRVGKVGYAPISENHNTGIQRPYTIQEPDFWPGEYSPGWPRLATPIGFQHVARGGISQWKKSGEISFSGFTIVNQTGETQKLVNLQPAQFILEVTAHKSREFNLRYAVVVTDHLGRIRTNICSQCDSIRLEQGQSRQVRVELLPLQLGEDEYIVSLGLYDYEPLELINSSVCHDLLSRCFEFEVVVPESMKTVAAEFNHPAVWQFPGEEI